MNKGPMMRRAMMWLAGLLVWGGGHAWGAEKPVLVLDADGHTAVVRKVLFSRDGKELLSVSDDKTIRVWDVASGEVLRTLRPPIGIGNEGKLYAAALDPDGTTLAVGCGWFRDNQWGSIYIISLATGRIERVLTGHENTINDLAFSSDGRRLISGSADQTARIWNVSLGKTEHVLRGHTKAIYGVTFSPDGRRCATASFDHTAAVWDMGTGQRQATLKGHSAGGRCIAWSPDGLVLATGSDDHSIRLWDVGQAARLSGTGGPPVLRTFDKLGDSNISSVTFTADSQRLLYTQTFSTAGSGNAAVLDVATGREVSRFDQHTNSIHAGTLSRDGALAATAGGGDTEIVLWKTADGTRVQKLVSRGRVPWAAAWSPDGTRIAWGNSNKGGAVKASNPLERTFDLAALEFGSAPDDRFGRAKPERGSLTLVPGSTNQVGVVSSVLVRQGDRTLATLAMNSPYERINCFTLLPGDRAAVGTVGTDYSLRMYEARTGKQLRRFQGHTGEIWAVSPSPDSRYLLSASGDMTLRVWDPEAVTTLSIAGIGVVLKKVGAGLEVISIVDGGTAKLDGRLKIGDILTAVDPGTGTFTESAPQSFAETVGMIRGEVRTKLRLKVRSPGDVEQMIELTRGRVSEAEPRVVPLLSCFFAGDDWIVWSPEGYYAASPGGEKLMGWHVNNGREQMASFFPARQFRSTLYRPDVIKLLLKTGSVEKALQVADTARGRMTEKTQVAEVLPPSVLIASPEGSVITADSGEITVRAVAQQVGRHPITSMQLLLDGRPLGGQAGIKQFATPQEKITERFFVPLEPGVKHTLQVRADSAVSYGVSSLIEVTFKKPDTQTKLPSLYVLAIGVKDYEKKELSLRFADEDARRIDRVFREKGAGLFQKVETKLIVNKEATRRGVLSGLSWLKQQMTQHDVGIVFYSGHGDKDSEGTFFLLPHDVDPAELGATGVSDVELKRVLQAIPCRVVLMLDACNAGAAGGDKRKGGLSLTDDLVRDLATDDYGVIVMASSTGREFSLESSDLKSGYFALALSEGLSGKADSNADKVVYSNELDAYVSDRVKSLSQGQQHPVTAKPGTVRSFPMSKQ